MQYVLWALLAAVLLVVALYYFSPQTIYSLLQKMLRRRAGLVSKSVKVGSHVCPYLEGGPSDGETVVLLHGFGGDKDVWPMYAKSLAKKYHLICPDLPGFGENDRSIDRDYGIPMQAAWLCEFLDALNISNCHIAGNSMGGHIALLFALEHPAYLKSLTLINNAGIATNVKSELRIAMEGGVNLLEVNSLDDVKRSFQFTAFKPAPMPRQFLKIFLKESIKHKELLDKIGHAVDEDGTNSPLNDRLGDLTTPTLIIWGRHDRVFDVSCAELMHAGVKGSELVILEETGHMPMIEKPEATAAAQLTFLSAI